MVIQLAEVRKAKRREYLREWIQANKEKSLAYQQKYRDANREKIRESSRSYREANREKVRERCRAWQNANKDKLAEKWRAYSEANKQKILERGRRYRETNKDKVLRSKRAYYEANREREIKQSLARAKERYSEDNTYRMAVNARNRVNDAIVKAGLKKSNRTIKLLGCRWETYRKWIESHFTDGMSWDNREEWHVDHTYPVMPAIQRFGEAAFPVVFNYRNCKPMWAEENRAKKDKIPPDSEIHPWVKKKLAALAEEQSE